MIELTARPAGAFRSEHAEGPMWQDGRLYWVDQYLGIVRVGAVAADGSGGAGAELEVLETWSFDGPTGAVVPHSGGGWAVSAGHSAWHVRPDGSRAEIAALPPDGEEPLRMNDGKADPLGRFWIGTMAMSKEPFAGALHVVERGRVSTALEGVSTSNGLVWDPTGRVMHYIDTPTLEVRRYLVGDGGRMVDDGVAVRIPDGAGDPDGMTIDRAGTLWVALWNGSAVHRYAPDGELLAVVHVDAPQVSSCVFAGPDLTTLLITTSQEDYTPEDSAAHPGAGLIFEVDVADLGAVGRPADAYRA